MSYKNQRIMNHNKPKMGYDVEIFKRCVSIILRPVLDDNISYVYIKQHDMKVVKAVIAMMQQDNPNVKYELIDEYQLRKLINEYQLVGFNNAEFDDYIIQAVIEKKSTQEIYELGQLVIQKNIQLWRKGYKRAFATFDIRSVLPKNISLKQLAAEAGYNIWEFNDVPWDYDGELNAKMLVKMIGYNDHDTIVTNKVFMNDEIQSAYKQHVAFIDQYLPGSDWLISASDASLAEKAITNNGKITIDRKKYFDFELNGHNVLSVIPKEWRDEYYRYSKDVERALVEWEKLVESGMSKFEAGKETFDKIENPQIDTVWLDDFFGLKPSAGGIHSETRNHPKYKPEGSNIVRAKDVDHYDIAGAYGATAKLKNLYGAAQDRYNLFMDDKFRYKNANKALEKNSNLDISKIKDGIYKHFSIKLEGKDLSSIKTELAGGVSASKLGTNSPTGKADSPVSNLFNPVGMIEIRMMLQCLFYDILKVLVDAGCVVFSANTDGFFLVRNGIDIAKYITDWEEKWGLTLDYDHVDEYIAKDDNNRILIEKGEIVEAKGDDLLHQKFIPSKSSKMPRIVDTVLLRKVINPKLDIRELLEEYKKDNRIDLFMWVLKATKNHVGVIDYKISQKINRVLLTTEGQQVGNYSIPKDKIETFINFPMGTPVAVINGELPKTLPDNINLDAYQALIEKVYQRWV